MSRVGILPIGIPSGVDVKIENNIVTVKGKLGELKQVVNKEISVKIDDNNIIVARSSELKKHKSMHGLYRALINNMVEGVTKGFSKQLEFVGVGYKVAAVGQILDMSLGFSHNILMEIPSEVKLEAETKKRANPKLTLSSIDKQLLGQVVAKIRSFRKPEPYKGKGIKFVGEQIRRKQGKLAAAAS